MVGLLLVDLPSGQRITLGIDMIADCVTVAVCDADNRFYLYKLPGELWRNRDEAEARRALIAEMLAQHPDFYPAKILE